MSTNYQKFEAEFMNESRKELYAEMAENRIDEYDIIELIEEALEAGWQAATMNALRLVQEDEERKCHKVN